VHAHAFVPEEEETEDDHEEREEDEEDEEEEEEEEDEARVCSRTPISGHIQHAEEDEEEDIMRKKKCGSLVRNSVSTQLCVCVCARARAMCVCLCVYYGCLCETTATFGRVGVCVLA
jgi:hypothetical protein